MTPASNRRNTPASELVEVANNPRLDGWERAQAVRELAERLEAAEREREKVRAMYEIASTVVDQEHAAAEAAESLNAELVEALELAHEWVHTYDSDDLDAVNADALIAAQGAVEDAVAKAKERSDVH